MQFRRCLCCVMLSIMTFGWLTSVMAASSRTYHFQREDAFAEFIMHNGACLQTVAQVSGIAFASQVTPDYRSRGTFVSIGIDQRNTCTQEVMLSASGNEYVAGQDFKLLGDLHGARLTTTLMVTDNIRGNSFPMTVDVQWSGTGETRAERRDNHTDLPTCHAREHVIYESRDATVTGSVVYSGTQISLTDVDTAFLMAERSQAVVKGCDEAE